MYQYKIASERHAFILYAEVPTGSHGSKAFPGSPFPHTLQFLKETTDDAFLTKLSGRIALNTAGTHLIHSMMGLDAFRVGHGICTVTNVRH